MKVGDIIYCKKTYKFLSYGIRMNQILRTWFIENKSYEVFFNTSSNKYYLIDEEGDENDVVLYDRFDEYFCTNKEYRKLKLKKLNTYNDNLFNFIDKISISNEWGYKFLNIQT